MGSGWSLRFIIGMIIMGLSITGFAMTIEDEDEIIHSKISTEKKWHLDFIQPYKKDSENLVGLRINQPLHLTDLLKIDLKSQFYQYKNEETFIKITQFKNDFDIKKQFTNQFDQMDLFYKFSIDINSLKQSVGIKKELSPRIALLASGRNIFDRQQARDLKNKPQINLNLESEISYKLNKKSHINVGFAFDDSTTTQINFRTTL